MQFNIQSAIKYSILTRCWQLFAGPLTIYCITNYLTLQDQGCYYTFTNILGITMLFDLGIGGWITRFIGQSYGQMSKERSGQIIQRLQATENFARKWYAAGSVLFLISSIIYGSVVLGVNTNANLMIWCILCVIVGTNFYLNHYCLIMEGMGLIEEINIFILIKTVIANFVLWAALYNRCRVSSMLYSNFLLLVITIIFTQLFWNRRKRSDAYDNTINLGQKGDISGVGRELLSLQWRTALSTVGGYLGSYLIVPTIYWKFSAEMAGKVGLTIALLTIIQSVSLTTITANVGYWSFAHGLGMRSKLHNSVFRNSSIALALMIGGVTVIGALILFRIELFAKYTDRLLKFRDFSLIAGIYVLDTIKDVFINVSRLARREVFWREQLFLGLGNCGVLYMSQVISTGLSGLLVILVVLKIIVTVVIIKRGARLYAEIV